MMQEVPAKPAIQSHEYQADLVDKVVINGIYQHSRNKNNYRVIAVSRHTQDLAWYVVYEALYDNEVSTIWHRPLEMFLEAVVIDGVATPRFIYVGMYEQK